MTDLDLAAQTTPILALVGPTAIGKTALSIGLAQEFNCEIISVDSVQVYRYMDIGTAKVSLSERQTIPHHLIDIVDPDEDYNAARFVKDCLAAVRSIYGRKMIPLLTGGTGLYLQALRNGLFPAPPTDKTIRESIQRRLAEEGSTALHEELNEYDPASAERIHPHDSSRVIRALEVYFSTGTTMTEHLRSQASTGSSGHLPSIITVGLTCERDYLYQRINRRTAQLFDLGLETEVRGLLSRGYDSGLNSMQSIGYRHMLQYIEGEWTLQQCREFLARDTRRYAKRQYTWFNRDESIRWFERDDSAGILTYLNEKLRSK